MRAAGEGGGEAAAQNRKHTGGGQWRGVFGQGGSRPALSWVDLPAFETLSSSKFPQDVPTLSAAPVSGAGAKSTPVSFTCHLPIKEQAGAKPWPPRKSADEKLLSKDSKQSRNYFSPLTQPPCALARRPPKEKKRQKTRQKKRTFRFGVSEFGQIWTSFGSLFLWLACACGLRPPA